MIRLRYESYHSSRPLKRSSGRSVHGENRTTLRSAPGGVRNGLSPVDGAPGTVFWFQKTPSCFREKPQLRAATKYHTLSRRIGPPRLSDWSHIFSVLFDVVTPRDWRSAVRFSLSILSSVKNPRRSR